MIDFINLFYYLIKIMSKKITRNELIQYIRINAPLITGVYKKNKAQLEEIYNKLTIPKEVEDLKVKKEIEQLKEFKKTEIKRVSKYTSFNDINDDDMPYLKNIVNDYIKDTGKCIPEYLIGKITVQKLIDIINKYKIYDHDFTEYNKKVKKEKEGLNNWIDDIIKGIQNKTNDIKLVEYIFNDKVYYYTPSD
jgi:hypothetical protein